MSEYQNYAFRAVDKRLTENQQAKVRQFSTRARITATSFDNEYHWGNFKGDPHHFLTEFFDVYTYWAIWPTRVLGLRLPPGSLDLDLIRQYEGSDCYGLEVLEVESGIILMFRADRNNGHWGGHWDDMDEERSWIFELTVLRNELLTGDLRSLYIAWLAGIESNCNDYGYDEDDEEDDDLQVPSTPPGMKALTSAQQSLATFLLVDKELFSFAIKSEVSSEGQDPMAGLEEWLMGLSHRIKAQALLQVVKGKAPNVARQLLAQYRETDAFQDVQKRLHGSGSTKNSAFAFMREFHKVKEVADELWREEASRKAVELLEEKRLERETYLRSLLGSEARYWCVVQNFIMKRNGSGYDYAIEQLIELRDMYKIQGDSASFEYKWREVARKHERKKNFLLMARKAGLS